MFLSASLFSLIFLCSKIHLLIKLFFSIYCFLAMFQPFLVRFLTWIFNSDSKWLKYVKIKVFLFQNKNFAAENSVCLRGLTSSFFRAFRRRDCF